MALRLFGYTLLSPKELSDGATSKTPSPIVPPNDQGATTVFEGGVGSFGQYAINFNDYISYDSEVQLINTYRNLALQPEVDEAISDIIHEMMIQEDDKPPVSINVDKLPKVYDKEFRKSVVKEFTYVLELLEFNSKAYDIAKQFYVDGRLYYDMIVDERKINDGIVELRNVDARTIKPIREIKESIHQETGVRLSHVVDEYFIFNPEGVQNHGQTGAGISAATIKGVAGAKIAKDRIAYINSGIFTPGNVQVLSHIHKAIKPYNQLRMVEDATVIYRVTRAPERRVFYIDVGDIPAAKAEAYLNTVAAKYRNKVTYNTTDGKISDSPKAMSMLEDFFLPRRGTTGKGTEVESLPAGQNLGEMEDVEYFKRKLYRALNIPLSRIEKDGGTFQLGRVAEISRDEIKFARFLVKLRERLAMIFDEILARHLTLKQIIKSPQQWHELRKYITYEFVSDSHFSELKDMEVLSARLDAVAKIDPYIGRFFSDQYIRDTILKQTQVEQESIDKALDEDPDQGPAMVLPKAAEGMRPAAVEGVNASGQVAPGFGDPEGAQVETKFEQPGKEPPKMKAEKPPAPSAKPTPKAGGNKTKAKVSEEVEYLAEDNDLDIEIDESGVILTSLTTESAK